MNALTERLPWLLNRFVRAARSHRPRRVDAPTPAITDPGDPVELAARRAEALRRLFPKLYSWYASRSEWSVAIEVHNYLAEATNVTDLENRIRAVEQRRAFGP